MAAGPEPERHSVDESRFAIESVSSFTTPARVAFLRGLAVGSGVFLLFGIVSGLVPTPVFDRMVPRTPVDYAFLTSTALLAGAYVFQKSRLEAAGLECSGDRCAYGGAAGGFLAVACPPCNAILVGLIGSSAAVTYVDPLRPVFGLIAVGLLGGIVYRRWTRAHD